MKRASLWLSGVLAIAALAAPSPVYHLWFRTPMTVSTLKLPPGPYSVSRDGGSAMFKNLSSGTFYIVRTQVDHTAQTNHSMKMEVVNRNGNQVLEVLTLPGQPTDLRFVS